MSERTYVLRSSHACGHSPCLNTHALLPLIQTFIFFQISPHIIKAVSDGMRWKRKVQQHKERLIVPTGFHLSFSLKPMFGTSVPNTAVLAKMPAVF